MAKENGKYKDFSESQKKEYRVRIIRRKYERKLILIQMSGGKCIKCGYNKNIRGLSFHHRNPEEKEFCLNINSLGRNWESILNEHSKCDLLCLNCHAEVESEKSIIDNSEFNKAIKETIVVEKKSEKRRCAFCKCKFHPRGDKNKFCSKRCAKKSKKNFKKLSVRKKFQNRINKSSIFIVGKQAERHNSCCKK